MITPNPNRPWPDDWPDRDRRLEPKVHALAPDSLSRIVYVLRTGLGVKADDCDVLRVVHWSRRLDYLRDVGVVRL